MDVLEIVEKIIQAGFSLDEIKKVKEEVAEIDKKIQKKKEEIKKLEEQRVAVISKLPEEIRDLVFGSKAMRRSGTGRRIRVRVNGVEFSSLSEAYYHLFPERRGKHYKFREELEKLAQKGEITLEYL